MTQAALKRAQETLMIEADAVREQLKHLNADFARAVDMIAGCSGRVAVMGIGKSGLIARKIAATMSSLGIPAVFSHPGECLHGDLGMFMPGDIVLMLSYTGETEEIKKLLPVIKGMGIAIIVMTGRTGAAVWKHADLIISCKIRKEACPFNLAPTASTTAVLALGDALALAASEKKGFRRETLAKLHPAGGLGKKLNVRVRDIMHSGKSNPLIRDDRTVSDALLIMTQTRLGAANVIDRSGKLVGFFTDGDLRRHLQNDRNILSRKIRDVMTKSPQTISPDVLAVEASRIFKKHSFDNIPVVNVQGKPVGILDERDLLAEGIA